MNETLNELINKAVRNGMKRCIYKEQLTILIAKIQASEEAGARLAKRIEELSSSGKTDR